ncbi:MAG: hypothetical protein BWY73_01554 [candidate division TA06 bacterium ADurb.Bin417]|uniref:Uncharacterized protein n=1 Tax=candidate division TA06 bacterium ADurb.Bin417 TaxID=1852828 RepID=A0A1V5M7I5_UNCT6|nr:MAG: hypothetical protein BWY73_01554 [candidate division TA06 bacterium ADurb.Bin417]
MKSVSLRFLFMMKTGSSLRSKRSFPPDHFASVSGFQYMSSASTLPAGQARERFRNSRTAGFQCMSFCGVLVA